MRAIQANKIPNEITSAMGVTLFIRIKIPSEIKKK
jgi:hypothetical protein